MRMLRCAAACVILAAVLPAADARLLSLVMPGARVLAGVNVEQAKATPFGQAVLEHLARNEEALHQFSEVTGFDPRRDVREVLFASDGGRDGNGRLQGLVLARGAFDVARIAQAARDQGGSVENYGGATVIVRPGKRGAVAFVDGTVAVAGAADEVRAALDRRGSPAPIDPALAAEVARLSASQHAWGVTDAIQQFVPAGLPGVLQAGLLNSIQLAGGGLIFGNEVDATAQVVAHTEQDASALALVARLLAQLAQTNPPKSEAAGLLKDLRVSTSGRVVNLALTIPEDEFERLIFKGR